MGHHFLGMLACEADLDTGPATSSKVLHWRIHQERPCAKPLA